METKTGANWKVKFKHLELKRRGFIMVDCHGGSIDSNLALPELEENA